MKRKFHKILSVALVLVMTFSVFAEYGLIYGKTRAASEAPVILRTEFYDNAKKTGGEIPASELSGDFTSDTAGTFTTPYTPGTYREGRYTTLSVYVQLDEGYSVSDYSFRWLCGVVDSEAYTAADRYITGECSVDNNSNGYVSISETELDGVKCVVCTFSIYQKPSLDLDPITVEMADGSVDLEQLSRYYCVVKRIEKDESVASASNDANALYVHEKYSRTSLRELVAFVKDNYDLSLLTTYVQYKDKNGNYTDEADGQSRRPGDSLELALYVPDLDEVPHITGMTTTAMNSNYSAFTANSPEMHLEWYASNQSENGEEYDEVYLGSSTYAMHELFHEWYYEWQETGNYLLGTNTVSKLHPETTYSVGDELAVQYKYAYCKMRIEIKFGTVPGFFSLTTDTFEIPGYTTEPEVVIVPGDANGDGVVNSRDMLQLKKYMAGKISVDILNFANTDITGDGKINSMDSLKLKRIITGK